jgi:hypothetical protein
MVQQAGPLPESGGIPGRAAEPEDCSICLRTVDPQTERHSQPHPASPCRHRFHWECMCQALEVQPLCPNCRYSYATEGVYDVDPSAGTRNFHVVTPQGGAAPRRPNVAANPELLEQFDDPTTDGWSTHAFAICDLLVDSVDPHSCHVVRVCLVPGASVSSSWKRADLGRFRVLLGALVSLCLLGSWLGLVLPMLLEPDRCEFVFPPRLLAQVVDGNGCGKSAVGLAVFTMSWAGFAASLCPTLTLLQ